jgi:hypothetical protein
MANAQKHAPIALSVISTATVASTTLALSAANTWLAFGFVPDSNRTLSKVRAYFSALGGSVGAGEISCSLYSDAAGQPNALVEARTTTTGAYAGSAWNEWTGFTTALTGGVQYWLVFKNLNATPATNFPTVRFGASNGGPIPAQGSSITYGWHRRSSTDGGATWPTSNFNSFGWRLEYADGSFDGWPASDAGANASTQGIFSDHMCGNIFTTRPNARLVVAGITFFLHRAGTPTGDLRYRIYQGSTLLATTNTVATANIVSGNTYVAYFTTPITLEPSTAYRVVISETTQSDTSANRFGSYCWTVDTDANSLALMPFGGTCMETYWDGSVWTDTSSRIMTFALLLDTNGAFATVAGGFPRRARWM